MLDFSQKTEKLYDKFLLSSERDCPLGLLTGVPDTRTEDALPWYPTGKYSLNIGREELISMSCKST